MVDQRSTMLRALKGAPVSIVLAQMLYPERSLGPAHLAALTGYSRNTISAALSALAELGLAQRHSRYSGWQLTTTTLQLFLPQPSTPELTDSTELTDCTAAAPHPDAQNSSLPTKAPPPDAQDLSLDAQNLRLPPTAVSSSTSPSTSKSKTTTNLLPADAPNSRLATILLEVGVYQPLALRLAQDPWCTVERAEGWIANIRHQMQAPNHPIRSLPALLSANLRHHAEPPPTPSSHQDTWHQFLCPVCGLYPCDCPH